MHSEWAKTYKLLDVEQGRDNNLNLIRFVLSSAVVLSHCYVILDRFRDEPMQRTFHFYDLGGIAVLAFFFLSGFLIFRSALRSDPTNFVRARALRIFPALTLAAIACALVLGPLATSLETSEYLSHSGTYRYLGTSLLFFGTGTLPGVFAGGNVNQPLWTLSSEWVLYMVLMSVCFWGAQKAKKPMGTSWTVPAVAVALTVVGLYISPLPWGYAVRWFGFAGIGVLAYVFRRHITLSLPVMVALVAADAALLLLYPIPGKLLFIPALTYAILTIGFHPALRVPLPKLVGDYSYGVYIFAWPFQQLFAAHHTEPLALFWASYSCALLAAVLSWHLLEKRCLNLKYGRLPTRVPA